MYTYIYSIHEMYVDHIQKQLAMCQNPGEAPWFSQQARFRGLELGTLRVSRVRWPIETWPFSSLETW